MPPAPTHSAQKAHDDNVRMEAALLYANGEHRGAINALIARINATNGHCDVRLWLELLDIYQAKDLQSPFEKLAGHFSSRFHLSPPAWTNIGTPAVHPVPGESDHKASGNTSGREQTNALTTGGGEGGAAGGRGLAAGGRVALLIDGSAMDVSTDKVRDVSRAARQHRQCRLDLSRMSLDTNDERAGQELVALLSIMQRIRRLHVSTMLMGDTELLTRVQARVDLRRDDLDRETPYWMMLFEILQWRGDETAFDAHANAYADLFSYCPVGFEANEVIARDPTQAKRPASAGREEVGHSPQASRSGVTDSGPLALSGEILDIQPITDFAQTQWAKRRTAVILMEDVTRVEAGAARSLATFLQVRTSGLGFGKEKSPVDFQQCSEAVASLLEGTGVSAYARIGTRHDKIRAAVEETSE